MHGHGRRTAYYIVGEGVFEEPAFLSGGDHACPAANAHGGQSNCPSFKFGRMFPMPPKSLTEQEWVELTDGLIRLGLCMNNPEKYCKEAASESTEDSTIPAGYTYLGQFIAHEITFDNTQDLPPVQLDPENLRSPSIDLDSLYGPERRDENSIRLYEEGNRARLKIGWTIPDEGVDRMFANDLPRDAETRKALIGDPRNDENLSVAQTTVALIRFHNRVVDTLKSQGHAEGDLFDFARMQVVRHFQWLILYDYLPTIVDRDVLDCVIRHRPRWFKLKRKEELFMPLEFSAAAFRIGHSMVRNRYHWNLYHPEAALGQLFAQTAFSGNIGQRDPQELPGQKGVLSQWVIDWRHFYEFPEGSVNRLDRGRINMARRIDTHFNFQLDLMAGFPHGDLPAEKRSITVRNLLRGFALGLPTGEEVAESIGETPLGHEEVGSGPHGALLANRVFKGKTPLWYYVLKEAELNGGSRLGRVGSRIVAETLVGLIENSSYSILDVPEWRPSYGRIDPETKSLKFGITDLLEYAGVVNALGGP